MFRNGFTSNESFLKMRILPLLSVRNILCVVSGAALNSTGISTVLLINSSFTSIESLAFSLFFSVIFFLPEELHAKKQVIYKSVIIPNDSLLKIAVLILTENKHNISML